MDPVQRQLILDELADRPELWSGEEVVCPMSTTDERYSRQKDIVPPERIAACKATVIGVGAIGRQVALQLTAMGIPWLQLVDFDVVETSNLASQGYLEEDLGKLKVEATAALCRRINSGVEIVPVCRSGSAAAWRSATRSSTAWTRSTSGGSSGRPSRTAASFYVDGRMSAEVLRVLTACDSPSRQPLSDDPVPQRKRPSSAPARPRRRSTAQYRGRPDDRSIHEVPEAASRRA